MTPILKDPDAVLRYTIAWPPSLIDGASISNAVWVVEPDEPGGLAASAHFIDGSETGAQFSGGIAGRVYHAVCRASLSDGRSADRALVIRVEHR